MARAPLENTPAPKPPVQRFTVPSTVKPQTVTRDGFGITSSAGVSAPPTNFVNGVPSGGGAASQQLPTMPEQSEDDWLSGDAAFQAQLAALLRASQDYDTDVTAQQTKYGVDYNDALKGLGWGQDDPTTADVNEGAWNFRDLNTAAGRSFQNQQNDFAGRGLLQSSLYGTANDNLTRSLNDQLGGINTAKQSFFDDLSRQQSSFKNENTLSQQQARAEALARRAASIV